SCSSDNSALPSQETNSDAGVIGVDPQEAGATVDATDENQIDAGALDDDAGQGDVNSADINPADSEPGDAQPADVSSTDIDASDPDPDAGSIDADSVDAPDWDGFSGDFRCHGQPLPDLVATELRIAGVTKEVTALQPLAGVTVE